MENKEVRDFVPALGNLHTAKIAIVFYHKNIDEKYSSAQV
jgi:3-keto-L-gulonate-6-phosphate decarboxylase